MRPSTALATIERAAQTFDSEGRHTQAVKLREAILHLTTREQANAQDAEGLEALEVRGWGVRPIEMEIGPGDTEKAWEVVGYFPSPPRERVMGYGRTPEQAIRAATVVWRRTAQATEGRPEPAPRFASGGYVTEPQGPRPLIGENRDCCNLSPAGAVCDGDHRQARADAAPGTVTQAQFIAQAPAPRYGTCPRCLGQGSSSKATACARCSGAGTVRLVGSM